MPLTTDRNLGSENVILFQSRSHHRLICLTLARIIHRKARHQWISGALKPRGMLTVDAGAAKALTQGKSLLAAGVTGLSGQFTKGDAVTVMTQDGAEIARGLIAYDAAEALKILGLKSGDIAATLGYDNGAALIHRDNLVMM